VGIIAEYNPFHNGHSWHVTQARRQSGCEAVIAVMSGNFVQRGEPALFDKWLRAEMAVSCGVDLVLELPVVFAVRSAEYFATAAIRLLSSLGIEQVCFGAEHPDLSTLSSVAKAIDDPKTISAFREQLGTGISYAAAMGRAVASHAQISPDIVAAPNNILAIEYLRAISKYAANVQPILIPRRQAGYHDTAICGEIASATAIRQLLRTNQDWRQIIGDVLPAVSARIINAAVDQGRGPIFYERFTQILLAKLRMTSPAKLAQLPDVNEGLEYKLKSSGTEASDFNELIYKLKTKRYSLTRLQRIFIYLLLGLTQTEIQSFDATGPLYGRILAFNPLGRMLLRQMADTAKIPLITKTTDYLCSKERDTKLLSPLQTMLAVDTQAADLYSLAMSAPDWRRGGSDFRVSPKYIPFGPTTVLLPE